MVEPGIPRGEQEELRKIEDLADQIYAEASHLAKAERHLISDAANLIKWICYQGAFPTDPEAIAAIAELQQSLCRDRFKKD